MADGREAGVRLVFVGLTQRANTSAFGGASVVIANLKKELVRMGMSVDVLVFARRDVTMLPVALDSRVNLQFLRGHSQGCSSFRSLVIWFGRGRVEALAAMRGVTDALALAVLVVGEDLAENAGDPLGRAGRWLCYWKRGPGAASLGGSSGPLRRIPRGFARGGGRGGHHRQCLAAFEPAYFRLSVIARAVSRSSPLVSINVWASCRC